MRPGGRGSVFPQTSRRGALGTEAEGHCAGNGEQYREGRQATVSRRSPDRNPAPIAGGRKHEAGGSQVPIGAAASRARR
jgi:hypothetical protein